MAMVGIMSQVAANVLGNIGAMNKDRNMMTAAYGMQGMVKIYTTSLPTAPCWQAAKNNLYFNLNPPPSPLLMHISVITLFPEMFTPLRLSIPGRALGKDLWKLDLVELRNFGIGPRKNVDAPCYSGGPGMLLRPDVVHEAVLHACTLSADKPRFIYLSGRGTPVTQKDLETYVQDPYLILLSGRYEGVDERVLEYWAFEQKRIGDFIVSGGEFPALMLIDGCVRCIPEALGNKDSLAQDSFQNGHLEHPQYTRPECWMDREVPFVLRSGHHAHIKAWKENNSSPLIP